MPVQIGGNRTEERKSELTMDDHAAAAAAASDTSVEFGDIRNLREFYDLHPIMKSISHELEHCNDIDPFFSHTRRERSKQRPAGDIKYLRAFYDLHPIMKSIRNNLEHCNDIDPLFSHTRRQRSKQGFSTEKKTTVKDTRNRKGTTVETSESECNKLEHCNDIDPPFSHTRRQRSKQGLSTEKKTAVKNTRNRKGTIVETSESECVIMTNPHKPQNKRPLNCVRRSRRLHHRASDDQKLGKLDSENFEIYMEKVWGRFSKEKKNAFTYFDSLWFCMYTEGLLKQKVLSWIKKKDIFLKKYVFVPIVQWSHWFLLIFCNFGEDLQANNEGRCILLLDSLGKANTNQLGPTIRRFVSDIFKNEGRPEEEHLIRNIPLLVPKVPQQTLGHECGFYVLYYINLFLQSDPENLTFSKGFPDFMKEDWFTPEDVECFAKELISMNGSSSNC